MKLTFISGDQRQVRLKLEVEVDRLRKCRLQHSFELAHDRVEVDGRKTRLGLARGSQELLDQGGPALDRFLYDLDRARNFPGLRAEGLELAGVAQNDGEDVVKIMRDTAGERAEAFHLLRLDELLFEPLPMRVVKEISLEMG